MKTRIEKDTLGDVAVLLTNTGERKPNGAATISPLDQLGPCRWRLCMLLAI